MDSRLSLNFCIRLLTCAHVLRALLPNWTRTSSTALLDVSVGTAVHKRVAKVVSSAPTGGADVALLQVDADVSLPDPLMWAVPSSAVVNSRDHALPISPSSSCSNCSSTSNPNRSYQEGMDVKVEEKFEKYFGYLARCEDFFCIWTLFF